MPLNLKPWRNTTAGLLALFLIVGLLLEWGGQFMGSRMTRFLVHLILGFLALKQSGISAHYLYTCFSPFHIYFPKWSLELYFFYFFKLFWSFSKYMFLYFKLTERAVTACLTRAIHYFLIYWRFCNEVTCRRL